MMDSFEDVKFELNLAKREALESIQRLNREIRVHQAKVAAIDMLFNGNTEITRPTPVVQVVGEC